MRRILSIAMALLVVGAVAARAAVAEPKGTTRTPVAGGWEGTPPAMLTSIDPATGKYTVVGRAVWTGDWVGVSIFHMTGTLNMTTGDYAATAETEFTGSWLGNRSQGTLTWHEAMTGNAVTQYLVRLGEGVDLRIPHPVGRGERVTKDEPRRTGVTVDAVVDLDAVHPNLHGNLPTVCRP